MAYFWAASKGGNAVRAACRKAPRLINVGERRNAASIQHYTCFTSGCDPSIANHQMEDGARTVPWTGLNYCINNEISLSNSDDNSEMLSESIQIRFVGALSISEEDDGG